MSAHPVSLFFQWIQGNQEENLTFQHSSSDADDNDQWEEQDENEIRIILPVQSIEEEKEEEKIFDFLDEWWARLRCL